MVTARRKAQLYLTAIVTLLAGLIVAPARLRGQTDQKLEVKAKDFAGTWHWMFQGKPFATMVLHLDGGRITGSITNEHINMDGNGKITIAEATEGISPIVRASLEKGVLHVVGKDGDDEIEWLIELKSADSAELRIGGVEAPPNAEGIRMERVE